VIDSLACVRQEFSQLSHTIKNQTRDFVDWHLGRPRYAFWAIAVDAAEIRQQLLLAQHHLAGLLLEQYKRQPHITLCVCGFSTDIVQYPDDFSDSALKAQVAQLNQLALQPFSIEIGALASFASAPFLHISDPTNSLSALHHGLGLAVPSDVNLKYIPHITVGLYSDSYAIHYVKQRLASFKTTALNFYVHRISLMTYHANTIGGALTTIADYDLDNRELIWYRPFC
jgi:2'-5' RNA ligase